MYCKSSIKPQSKYSTLRWLFIGEGRVVERGGFFICIPKRGNLKSNLNVEDDSSIINKSIRLTRVFVCEGVGGGL